jgi:hypothetical protein
MAASGTGWGWTRGVQIADGLLPMFPGLAFRHAERYFNFEEKSRCRSAADVANVNGRLN